MAANPRAYGVDVPIDLRVVSGLVAPEITPQKENSDQNYQGNDNQDPLRAWVA